MRAGREGSVDRQIRHNGAPESKQRQYSDMFYGHPVKPFKIRPTIITISSVQNKNNYVIDEFHAVESYFASKWQGIIFLFLLVGQLQMILVPSDHLTVLTANYSSKTFILKLNYVSELILSSLNLVQLFLFGGEKSIKLSLAETALKVV